MTKRKRLSTVEEIKAISDPYRIQILTTFKMRGKPSTVKQIADEMKEVPAKVHYHVKKLESVDILKLTHTKEINGIIAKYYEPTADRFEIKSETVDPTVKNLILDETRKTIAYVYNNSREIVFESLDNQEEDSFSNIQTATLALSKEEAEYFNNFINDFVEKHKISENTDKNKKTYHFFYSFFTLKE